MAWTPEGLRKVSEQVKAGELPSVSVRELLRWFGSYRRGRNVVSQIRQSFRHLDLTTEPDFDRVWIHGSVTIKRREGETPTPSPVVTKTTVAEQAAETEPSSAPQAILSTSDDAVVSTSLSPVEKVESQETVPVVRTLEGQDPSYSVGKLEAANRAPIAVAPDKTIKEAVTLMLAGDYSQLPVMQGERSVKGLFSWKSLGSRLALGRKCETVADAMESVQTVSAEASIFQVAEIAARDEVVLVRASATDTKIVGIVTTADVAEQFGSLGEPFLLIGEVENRIRVLIDGKFTLQELQAAKAPGDDGRKIESVADLTFGEYIWHLQKPENWDKCKLGVDRNIFIKELDKVRDVRNDVMHFEPDGIDPDALNSLRQFAKFLSRLASLSS